MKGAEVKTFQLRSERGTRDEDYTIIDHAWRQDRAAHDFPGSFSRFCVDSLESV